MVPATPAAAADPDTTLTLPVHGLDCADQFWGRHCTCRV